MKRRGKPRKETEEEFLDGFKKRNGMNKKNDKSMKLIDQIHNNIFDISIYVDAKYLTVGRLLAACLQILLKK